MTKKKNLKLIIILGILFLVIILIIIAKLNTNQSSKINSSSTNLSSETSNSSSNTSSPIKTTPTSNHIGETNSTGDTMYYESDLTQDFNGSDPIVTRTYTTPTSSPNQESTEEDIGDISLDFPMERYFPYQGRNFRLEKYYEANNIEVLVADKSKTDLAQEEMKQWLIDQGDDQYDTFTIVYQ